VHLNIKNLLKSLWWIVVLCFIIFFLHSNLHRVDSVIHRLPAGSIFFSILSLIAGKLLLTWIMHQTLQRHDVNLLPSHCFAVYHISQLGKYIPGSIWHYVGKIGMYKSAGLNNRTIRDTIILESFWIAFSALVIGIFLIAITQYQLLISLYQKTPKSVPIILITAFCIFLLLPNLSVWRAKISRYWRRLLFTRKSFFTALLIWLALGFAFWITLIPFSTSEIGFTYIVGLYALSYAIGFVVPFAPAGLGIRESVLVLGLMPFLDFNTSIILATLNRIFYIVVEITLAALAVPISRYSRS
jgi:hypothetical protein